MIFNFFSNTQKRQTKHQAQSLYQAIVAAARQPQLYRDYGVPDTREGRFELLVLYLFLVISRLKSAGEDKLAQALVDHFFVDMDHNLRELGVSDVAVGKKLRKLEEVYYGRLLAYQRGVESGHHDELAASLARNLYGGAGERRDAEQMAVYMMNAHAYLNSLSLSQLLSPEVQLYETSNP